MSQSDFVSVTIVTYNSGRFIKRCLESVLSQKYPDLEIIVVDNASTDGTRDILKKYEGSADIRVFYHEKNQGKGAAIRTAFQNVTGDVVIIQDADLEYDPKDYPNLLEPIQAGLADVVYGTRFYGGGAHRVLFFWHYLGNQALTFMSNMLTNLNLSDMEVGYKVFRAEVMKDIKLKSSRFGFEPEITLKLAKKRCRFYEVPISYHGRTYAEGKKITWKDGIAALYYLIRFRLAD